MDKRTELLTRAVKALQRSAPFRDEDCADDYLEAEFNEHHAVTRALMDALSEPALGDVAGGALCTVRVQWYTPDADQQILYMARVSNPKGQSSDNARLLTYLMEHGHVSPFQMAQACLEVTAPRDITRQVLRHWAMLNHELDAQEFSQRYQDAGELPEAPLREARMAHPTNRQMSLPCNDPAVAGWWGEQQQRLLADTRRVYAAALERGIAKEVARTVLMEGLTQSRMYLSGSLRSWIHYLQVRLDSSATQHEHVVLAREIRRALHTVAPLTMAAFFGELA